MDTRVGNLYRRTLRTNAHITDYCTKMSSTCESPRTDFSTDKDLRQPKEQAFCLDRYNLNRHFSDYHLNITPSCMNLMFSPRSSPPTASNFTTISQPTSIP